MSDITSIEEERKGIDAAGWASLSNTLSQIPRPERRLATVSLTLEDVEEMSMQELRHHAKTLGLKSYDSLLRPALLEKVVVALGSPSPSATCPKCGRVGATAELFGFRITKTETKKEGVVMRRIRQSWCRWCRSKNARVSTKLVVEE